MSSLASVAVTGTPTSVPPGEFSATRRVGVAAANTGGTFPAVTRTAALVAVLFGPCPSV